MINIAKVNKSTTIIMEEIDYPLDLWFIISEYIDPEVVGKFSSICRSSYYVTTTAKFWFHMYKRFYKASPCIPERLKPQRMTCRHGLRACVIRMLHFNYFPRLRDINQYVQSEDPHSLVGRRCCSMWHTIIKGRPYFFFKFKEISSTKKKLVTTKPNKSKESFVQISENVLENSEEHCKILRIVGSQYKNLPLVMGSILQAVSLNLAPGFKRHRLKLCFGATKLPDTLSNELIINEVINYDVLNWWQPGYLFPYPITTVEFNTKDLIDCWETIEDNDDSA